MANYDFYGYAPDAITIDPDDGSFALKSGYKFSNDRVQFQISDTGDSDFDGDGHSNGNNSWDEQGEDRNQNGKVVDNEGNQIATGKIYVEDVTIIQAPDGSTIELHRIEVNGEHVGYAPSEPLEPGVSYAFVETRDLGDDNAEDHGAQSYSYYEQNSVPCFGPGTMITTQNGEIPVEWLDTSDKVLTRDHGFQPILWIGRTKIAPEYFERFPDERPVRIPAGTLGPNCPTHDLQLTGDHRIMVQSAEAELMYFSAEVLAPAKAWVDAGIGNLLSPSQEYMVTHLLCASHQIIVAQGAWVESMFTGVQTLRRLGGKDIAQLENLLGPDLHCQQTARPCLTRKEARLLLWPMRDARRRQILKSA